MRHLLTACAVVGLTGCLEVGDPLLAVRDTTPPTVQSTDPAANATIGADGTLKITFSELMDVRTLRPGIAVFSGRDELHLNISVPGDTQIDENVERGDISETVMVNADADGNRFPANSLLTLVLRTSLTDYEGNALVEEVRVPFRTGP